MPQFFDLPRELRDVIYMSLITWSRPKPTLQDTANTWAWCRTGSHQLDVQFASDQPPRTCANFLAANRQINLEMKQALERTRRAGTLTARLDCIVLKNQDSEQFYFTWLSIPITTRPKVAVKHKSAVRAWAPNVPVVGRLLASPARKNSLDNSSPTRIEHLQIDMRLFDESASNSPAQSPRNTSWAVCAALNNICDPSPNNTDSWPKSLAIDTLVLNVVSPTDSSARTGDAEPAQDSVAREVAQDLVDVWNKLWSGDEYNSRCYRRLLGKIKRVRVCVDGVLVRERELSLELERGQAEGRRIAQRAGW